MILFKFRSQQFTRLQARLTRIVRSAEPEMIFSLSNCKHRTESVCPLKVFVHRPVCKFHILSVLSYEPLIRILPSTCRHLTVSVWPRNVILHVTLDQSRPQFDKSHALIVWSAEPLNSLFSFPSKCKHLIVPEWPNRFR